MTVTGLETIDASVRETNDRLRTLSPDPVGAG
jgi:hypothetical protein